METNQPKKDKEKKPKVDKKKLEAKMSAKEKLVTDKKIIRK
jgi:hypothetical protein